MKKALLILISGLFFSPVISQTTSQKIVVIGNDTIICVRFIETAESSMNDRVYSSQIEPALDWYAGCLKLNQKNCASYGYRIIEPLNRSGLKSEYKIELNFYDSIQKVHDLRFKQIDDSIAQIAIQRRMEQQAIEEKERQARERKERIANAERQKKRKAALIEKYGEQYAKSIIQGRVLPGMTKEMCIEAWGSPQDINRTTTAYRIHEQWVYNSKSRLYFDDGVLTTVQN